MPTTPAAPLLLVGESFSPWTKKARWALEHCEIAYGYREYTPTLSEPALRWRLRQWSGTVSVPILFAADETCHGSWAVARHAAGRVGDDRLGDFDETECWNVLGDAALAEGRMRVLRGISDNGTALEESLPAFVPGALRRPLRFAARDAVNRLEGKYSHLVRAGALREALVKTRQALANAEGDFLLGRFSYADICMAVVLEIVAPIARTSPPLGPATERCWHDPTLATEFSDLLAWRNRLAADPATSYSQFSA